MSGRVRVVLGVLGGVVSLAVVGAIGGFAWVSSTANARMAQTFETHRVEFPIPFPLSEAEVAALRAERAAALPEAGPDEAAADPLDGVDLAAIALERAIARGKHLVAARYACVECHGADFGGGTMIDDPAIGGLFGPNLTPGEGGRVGAYGPADWDRAVRHGVLPDGKVSAMPAEDFFAMSDRELSDIVAYIRTAPAVDRTMAATSFGPLGTVLMATGAMPISAEHAAHDGAHAVEPPDAADTVAFGKHLLQVCTGCHRADLSGGPMAFGPPDWAPAANLSPHEQGLAGWAFEDFNRALREGRSKGGAELKLPMTLMLPYAQNMTEAEVQAMWAYLQTVPPVPLGE